MNYKRKANTTLTAIEMDKEDGLDFTLFNGETVSIKLLDTGAEVLSTTLPEPGVWTWKARTDYTFHCDLLINGRKHRIVREVPTQNSFYEPLETDGIRLWFDAAEAVFGILKENHGACRPKKAARIALQDSTRSIAPVRLHPWCPVTDGILRIKDCYHGENCWLGSYSGTDAHGGLDLNHPDGTPLFMPFDINWQYCYHRLEYGDSNNRWRGYRFWDDGSVWVIRSAHMRKMLVEDGQPVKTGTHYAIGAGASVSYPGGHEHSHFAFGIVEPEGILWLDPWILFRQMYLDNTSEFMKSLNSHFIPKDSSK